MPAERAAYQNQNVVAHGTSSQPAEHKRGASEINAKLSPAHSVGLPDPPPPFSLGAIKDAPKIPFFAPPPSLDQDAFVSYGSVGSKKAEFVETGATLRSQVHAYDGLRHVHSQPLRVAPAYSPEEELAAASAPPVLPSFASLMEERRLGRRVDLQQMQQRAASLPDARLASPRFAQKMVFVFKLESVHHSRHH